MGELTDLATFAPLLERAGFRVLMTLPLLEPTPGQESPYSPCSAFALDPLYVSLDAVEEMKALGGRAALHAQDQRELDEARGGLALRHDLVRPLKQRWLARCHARFVESASAERREDFARFRSAHAHWLPDYALFRAIKGHETQSWREWPEGLRTRSPEALATARRELEVDIARNEYVQWIAFRQLEATRRVLAQRGILLGGDEPFLTAEDSADVWSRQDLFRFDATVGAPPDAFSATGQNWGLPPYRWDRIAESGYALFRARGQHAAKLFDLTRIDHVVGLYRTYHWPLDHTDAYFVPADEGAQRAQGEAVLGAMAEGGAALVAEDLGVIPDFVRESLDRLEIPGFRVLRWEQRNGQFRQPSEWPAISLATSGTHDTETSPVWWDQLPDHERDAIRAIPSFGEVPTDVASAYNRHVHEALFRALLGSASNLAIVPIQDVFAIRDRINTPNTVGPHNWSWRLPWSLESMADEDHIVGQLDWFGALNRRTGRFEAR